MGILPNDIEILSPYDDRIFKRVLTAPEAEPALKYLASAIINRPVVSVEVRNIELPVDDTEEKLERFDVNCKIDDDTQADIEMQASRMEEDKDSEHANLRARSIYNLCDLHSSQPSKGKAYDNLIQTYQVMFCGFTVFPDKKDYINRFSMRHDIDNTLLHDAIQAVFVELTKLNDILTKSAEQMTDMEKFSVFLRYADNPDYRDVVNKVIEHEEGLAVAAEVLTTISRDERERAIFRSRRIAMADAESNRVTAERRGEKKGRIAIAKIMLTKNEPIEKIIEYTGLTKKEVEALCVADK